MKNFDNFLGESPRVKGLEPNKNPTEIQRAYASKDVGKRKAVKNIAQRIGLGGDTYAGQVAALTGNDSGEGPNPEETQQTLQKAKEYEWETSNKGNPNWKSPEYKAAHSAKKRELGRDLTPEEQQELVTSGTDSATADDSVAARMDRAAKVIGPRGGLTGDKSRNDALDKLGQDGAAAGIPAGFDIPGEEGKESPGRVQKIAGHRHLFQPEIDSEPMPRNFPDPQTLGSDGKWNNDEDGLNYHYDGKTWRREMDADAVDTLIANTADNREEPELTKDKDGKVRTQVRQQSKGWGENPHNPQPSGEEMKTFSREALQTAFDEGEIDQERFQKSLDLIKAFTPGEEDPKAVQNLSFSQYVGETGDDHPAIEEFLNSTKINTDLSQRGLGGKITTPEGKVNRTERGYGGNLGQKAEKYRVPNSPDGVYNLKDMQKKDKELYKQAVKNREQEVVRTYLKQNGRNSYSWWEGHRSIEDMNLEHIQSLADDGWDHPENWVWAGEELNKMKNEYNIADRADTFMEPELAVKPPGKGFNAWKDNAAKEQGKNNKEFGDEVKGNIPELSLKKDDYGRLSKKEIDAARQKAIDIGMSPKDAEAMLPDIKTIRKGFRDDPDGYEEDRIQKETDRMIKDSALNKIRMQQNLSSLEAAAETQAGKDVLLKLDTWGKPGSKRRPIERPSIDVDDF